MVTVALAGLPAFPLAGSSERDQLAGALVCEGDSLGIVRGIADKGVANFKSGIASAVAGYSKSLPIEIIILRHPITLHGAKTRLVFGDVEGQLGLFPAAVFGIFEGDYRQAVAALSLKATESKESGEGVVFTNAKQNPDPGKDAEVCPDTIFLSPIEESRFYLGCGWCSG